jgi:hypothetical protein
MILDAPCQEAPLRKHHTHPSHNGTAVPFSPPPRERTLRDLLGYTDTHLAVTDPLEMNLLVAKEIPGREHLDISAYKRTADGWANEIKQGLREAEREFHRTPHDWKNDLNFFRLGYLCWYVDVQLKIRYREDQKDLQSVIYTDPDDLFLNGVMDSRRGTCGNMAALHVALGWRFRWPVSLASVGSHLICCYDDGKVTHNIEATRTGGEGFHSHPDDYYLRTHRLTRKAVDCGSDLRALSPREMLGVFVGFRARFYENTGKFEAAEADYLLARSLYPRSRKLHLAQLVVSVQNGMDLFEAWERGHPVEMARWLQEVVRLAPWQYQPNGQYKEKTDAGTTNREHTYTYDLSGRESPAES